MNSRDGERVGLDADQAEQPDDEALDLVAHRLDVARVRWRLQRADEVHRDARTWSPACRS